MQTKMKEEKKILHTKKKFEHFLFGTTHSYYLINLHLQRTDVSVAVDNLISVLGDIEFRLAMQNLRANEPETAVSHLKLATTHRHPEAAFNLGVCYETGTGIQQNMKNAMECYRTAASLGHGNAMYNLGIFYIKGRGGLTKNREAARACFEAAKNIGSNRAERLLRLPEKPVVKQDNEIDWKSYDLIQKQLSAVDLNDKTTAAVKDARS